MNANDESVVYHLAFHVAVVAGCYQVVESHYVLLHGFFSLLVATVKACSLEYYVATSIEERIQLVNDLRILFVIIAVAPVDVRNDSGSSPRQYRSVLTCLGPCVSARSDASQYCWSSGFRKSKAGGGVSWKTFGIHWVRKFS